MRPSSSSSSTGTTSNALFLASATGDDKVNTEIGSSSVGNSSTTSGSSMGTQSNTSSFKVMLLIMMVLQNSATVLVGRYTRTAVQNKDELYDVNHLIVVIELGKLLLSCLFENYFTQGKLLQSIVTYIINTPIDTIKIMIPALLYLIQNTLLYVALSNLTAPIFQVTYQAKLVTTAIVSVFLLRRSYSVQQWICLVVLSLGVAIVVLGEQSSTSGGGSSNKRMLQSVDTKPAQNLVVGLTAVTIACFSSALAGVYFEMVLKVPNSSDATKHPPASLWMRNIQLSIFSVIIAILQGLMKESKTDAAGIQQSYLHGFNMWVWILVILQSGGGLLVAAVIKYADNVLKGLATGVSVVVATVFSLALFGTPLSNQFSVGAVMILSAVYYFSNPLPTSVTSLFISATNKNSSAMDKEQNTIETKSLLPK